MNVLEYIPEGCACGIGKGKGQPHFTMLSNDFTGLKVSAHSKTN